MKKLLLPLVCTLLFFSCKSHSNEPDVSAIKVNLQVKRFDQDFFAIDTNHVAEGMAALLKKYPKFLPDYVGNILGLDLDSLLVPGNPQNKGIRMFIHDYAWVKDSSDLLYKDFSPVTAQVIHALKLVKYYFPGYKLPQALIPFIGPINANFETSFGTQGDILTEEGLGVGLQLHLGKNFSMYHTTIGQEQYPKYLSNNFDAIHIPVNCMRNIIDDLYPDHSDGKPLVEQMVSKGRRIYLLTRFLPETPEYDCLGYDKKQWKDSYTNEAVIWNFFLDNNLLQNSDINTTKNYIGESPKTQELGDAAPGNIGTFAGLQIVKKYMEKYPATTLQELMGTDPGTIFDKAKYKPRG